MVVIARTTTIDVDRLRSAVASIFERRGTHDVPARLAEPPAEWARSWAALVEHLPADATLADGYITAARLWDPILAGEITSGTWEAERGL
jgi:hypothetical protein